MSHCNFPCGVWPRSSNGPIAILKNTLVLDQLTNRNQEFAQWTNRKQRGSQRNSVDISPINVRSLICFYLNCGNGNADISSEEHFENSKTRRGPALLYYSSRTVFFCPNIWILCTNIWNLSRDPVPLSRLFLTVSCLFSMPGFIEADKTT
jgi:hypothetical protein